MPEAPFVNKYTHRKVAEAKARPCELSTCYRGTSSVLVTPENKDFFYVCPSHLKDRNFCTPVVDEAAAQAKKQKEMDEELERVKKEYEEKQKKKKEKEKEEKDKEKEKDKDKDDDKDKEDKDGQKKDEKGASKSDDKGTSETSPAPEAEPRVFTLHKTFFDMRLAKKQEKDKARRDQERMAQPNFFPSVPKGAPGASSGS